MWNLIYDRALLMFGQATDAAGAESVPFSVQAGPGTGQFQHTIWHTILLVVYFIVCLGLVVAVLLQTTKNEGLSGMMGGGSQSVFKGKKGFEEQLQQITNFLAITFVVMSLLVTAFAFRVR
jgi:preprotein translocase subunit SecG